MNDYNILYDILTSKALAYWYMDDGTLSNKAAKSLVLCTHGYAYSVVETLSLILYDKFKLITKIGISRNQHIIRISANSYAKFKELIYDILIEIPSMESKLPF